MRRTQLRTRYRDTGPDKATVELVLERCSFFCEVCHDGLRGLRGEGWQIHHRRPRSMGGSSWPGINLASNLLVLCAFDHSDIESRRAHGQATGRLVPWPLEPANVAVLRWDHWTYLLNDGTTSANPPVGAA